MATAATILANNRSVERAFVLEVEGYNVAFTTHQDTSALAASWSTWSNFIAGLEEPGALSRSFKMLLPKFEGPDLALELIDVDGTLVGLFADADTSAKSTSTTADVNRSATTIPVKSTTGFAASGAIYVGRERITYTGKTATSFTGCTRGTFPFGGKASWAHTHRIGDEGLGIEVRDKPAIWKGRGVNLYLTAIDPATDAWVPKADALLWFAGFIEGGSRTSDGTWKLSCSSVEKLASRNLLGEQFRARLAEGFDVRGDDVNIDVSEWVVRRLVEPAYNKSTTITITAGHYTLGAYLEAVNVALAAAKAAGNLANRWSLSLGSSNRLVITVYDATAHDGGDAFTFQFYATFRMWEILGEIPRITGYSVPSSGTGMTVTITSPLAPFIITATPDQSSIVVDVVKGTWIVQPSDEISSVTPGAEGYIQIGADNDILWGVTYNSGTKTFTRTGRMTFKGLPGKSVLDFHGLENGLRAGEDIDLSMRQVYWTVPMPVSRVLLRMLESTGTTDYNDATYDKWAGQMGLGIPSTLIDASSVQAVDGWSLASMILVEPAPAEDYINSFAGVLGFYLTWKDGLITVVTPNTIGGQTADFTLTNDSMLDHVDMDFGTDQIANVATLNYNRDSLAGDYLSSETYVNVPSQYEHGAADAVEYDAPWLFTDASGLTSWRENVVGPLLAYFGRAIRTYTVRCARNMLGVAPGHIIEWTDDDAPDAETGLYGLTAVKAWVIGTDYDPRGEEVTLKLLRPTGRNFSMPPSLMLDYSRGDKGYDSAGPYLYFRQHEFSYTSETDDVTRLSVGDKIRIVEVDTAAPAAPVTWLRTVAAVTAGSQRITLDTALSAPAFDTSKRYYVEFDDYSTVQATQQTKAYIADDADQLVQDTYAAFLWGMFAPAVESAVPVGTNRVRRPYNQSFVDGEPMSPHKLRDTANNANNLYAYVTNQHPISRQFETDRTTTSTSYEVLVMPCLVWCPPGAVSLEISMWVYALTSGAPPQEANFRITSSPTPPIGTVAAAVFPVDKKQVVVNTTSGTLEKKTTTLAVLPGQDGKTYITVEGQRVTGAGAYLLGISARFAARSVS